VTPVFVARSPSPHLPKALLILAVAFTLAGGKALMATFNTLTGNVHHDHSFSVRCAIDHALARVFGGATPQDPRRHGGCAALHYAA
jgi:hypothetical protein